MTSKPGHEESMTLRGVLRRHGETTSVKGVPKVLKSRVIALKCLWCFAVIFGGGIALFQLTTLMLKYFSYPTTTNVREEQHAPEFPDVTFCSLNPVTDALDDDVTPDGYAQGLWRFAEREMYAQGMDELTYFRSLIPESNLTYEEEYEIASIIYSASGFYQSFPFNTDTLDRTIEGFVRGIFRDCVFYSWDMAPLDITCDKSTVRGFYHPEHLACFTVSVPDRYSEQVKGISTVMYIHEQHHATFPVFKLNILHHKSRGVKVTTHPRHTLPPLADCDYVSPGHETNIRMYPAYIHQLPQPYGLCSAREYLELDPDDIADADDHGYVVYNYTSESCRSHCYQEHVVKTCKCIDPIYGYTEMQLKTKHAGKPLCGNTTFIDVDGEGRKWLDVTGAKMARMLGPMLCAIRERKKVENISCDCPKGCRYKTYSKSISQAPWPTTDHQLGFIFEYINGTDISQYFPIQMKIMDKTLSPNASVSGNELHKLFEADDSIRDNFLQVNILLHDKVYEVVSETATMTWEVILSNMGGTFNLWIGISFITVIELTELLYHLLALLGGNQRTTTGDDNKTHGSNKINAMHS